MLGRGCRARVAFKKIRMPALCLLCACALALGFALPPAAARADTLEGLFAGKFRAGSQLFDCQRGPAGDGVWRVSGLTYPYAYNEGRQQFVAAELANRYFVFRQTDKVSGDSPALPIVGLYLLNESDDTPAVVPGKVPEARNGLVVEGSIMVVADEGILFISPSEYGSLGYLISNAAGYHYGDFSGGAPLYLRENRIANPTLEQLKDYNASDILIEAGDILLRFYPNGENVTGMPDPPYRIKKVDVSFPIDESLSPSRAGHAFVSWNRQPDGSGTTYLPGAVYQSNVGLNLYAQWKDTTASALPQSPPTGVGVAHAAARGGSGSLTATDAAMQYRTAADPNTWYWCTAPATAVPAGEYWVRYAPKPGYDASPEVYVGKVLEPAATPVEADFTLAHLTARGGSDGSITQNDPAISYEYRPAGIGAYVPFANEKAEGLPMGAVQVRVCAAEGLHAASLPLTLRIKQPAEGAPAPASFTVSHVTTYGGWDGAMVGGSNDTEYQRPNSDYWEGFWDGKATSLSAGDYLVRYRETETTLASPPITLTVKQPAEGATAPTVGKTDATVYGGNGAITGTSLLMEYNRVGETDPNGLLVWRACSAGSTAVKAGTYRVRYGEAGASGLSPWAEVTIGQPLQTVCDFLVDNTPVPDRTITTDYRYEDNVLTILSDKPMTITMRSGITETEADRIKITGNAHVTLNNVRINGGYSDSAFCALELNGSANLTLTLTGSNYLRSKNSAGILAPANQSLTLRGSGSLTAMGEGNYAGIGNGLWDPFGSINITGGTITAIGGIGLGGQSWGAGGSVTISGTADVTATGRNSNALNAPAATAAEGLLALAGASEADLANITAQSGSTSLANRYQRHLRVFPITHVLAFQLEPSNRQLNAGEIAASDTLTAAVTVANKTTLAVDPALSATLRWYACDASGNLTSDVLASGGTFPLPATLAPGTYHYCCQADFFDVPAKQGAKPLSSRTAQITVRAGTYTLTLHSNGGDTDGSATATYASDTLTALVHAAHANHTLNGYFTLPTGGQMIMTPGGALAANVPGYTDADGKWIKPEAATLYAQWTALPATPLAAPAHLAWNAAVAQWSDVANATGYSVRLYQNSTQAANRLGAPVSVPANARPDFAAVIEAGGTGTYFFDVMATGDGAVYTNSPWSPVSAGYAYAAPVNPSPLQNLIAGIAAGSVYTQGDVVTFTAIGSGMDNLAPKNGDTWYYPSHWETNPSGDFTSGFTQSFSTAGMSLGAHTLTVTFARQRYNGADWMELTPDEADVKSVSFTLIPPPPPPPRTGDSANPALWAALGLMASAGLWRLKRKKRH